MSARHSKGKRYWSGEVTRRSNALDLDRGVFTWKNPKRIAKSLKRSAEESARKKGTPYQSAMSMLTFYINRAGKNLTADQASVLSRAKSELRKLFDKEQKYARLILQMGLFCLRDFETHPELVPLELHVPYWIRFYGAGEYAHVRVLNAVRDCFEGGKACASFEAQLASYAGYGQYLTTKRDWRKLERAVE